MKVKLTNKMVGALFVLTLEKFYTKSDQENNIFMRPALEILRFIIS